jgi:hypothetical protein
LEIASDAAFVALAQAETGFRAGRALTVAPREAFRTPIRAAIFPAIVAKTDDPRAPAAAHEATCEADDVFAELGEDARDVVVNATDRSPGLGLVARRRANRAVA